MRPRAVARRPYGGDSYNNALKGGGRFVRLSFLSGAAPAARGKGGVLFMLLCGKVCRRRKPIGMPLQGKKGREFRPFGKCERGAPSVGMSGRSTILSRKARTQHSPPAKKRRHNDPRRKARCGRPRQRCGHRAALSRKKCGGSPFFDKKQTPPRNVSANSIKETPKPQICVVPTPESADTTQPRRKARVQHYTDRKARRDALFGKKAARRARVSAVFRQNWDAETDVTVIHHLCRIRPEKPRSVRRTDRKPCGCTKPCFRGRSAAPVCAAASLRSRFSRRIALPAGRLFPQDGRCAKGARPAAFSGGAGSFCAMPCFRTDRPVLLSRRRGGRGRARARA